MELKNTKREFAENRFLTGQKRLIKMSKKGIQYFWDFLLVVFQVRPITAQVLRGADQ